MVPHIPPHNIQVPSPSGGGLYRLMKPPDYTTLIIYGERNSPLLLFTSNTQYRGQRSEGKRGVPLGRCPGKLASLLVYQMTSDNPSPKSEKTRGRIGWLCCISSDITFLVKKKGGGWDNVLCVGLIPKYPGRFKRSQEETRS